MDPRVINMGERVDELLEMDLTRAGWPPYDRKEHKQPKGGAREPPRGQDPEFKLPPALESLILPFPDRPA